MRGRLLDVTLLHTEDAGPTVATASDYALRFETDRHLTPEAIAGPRWCFLDVLERTVLNEDAP
jgi:hypothetical protein